MHNFQQLFKDDDDDDNDGEEDYLNFLRVLPSSIYSALLIFNELSRSLSPPLVACKHFLSSVPPSIPSFLPIHFCCCIDDDDDEDDKRP